MKKRLQNFYRQLTQWKKTKKGPAPMYPMKWYNEVNKSVKSKLINQ